MSAIWKDEKSSVLPGPPSLRRVRPRLVMSDPLRELVLRHADAGEISRAAAAHGMHSMFEDGLRKALAGETTIEEVLRVTQEDQE